MPDINGLNYWAIAVAWLIGIALGSFWYSPAGFGKLWSKLSGVDIMKMPKAQANRAIGFVAAASLVQSVTLAIVLNSMQADDAVSGLLAGLLLWFGLTAATTVGNTLYSRQSWTFWWLNSSFFLIVMSVNSVMLAIWH